MTDDRSTRRRRQRHRQRQGGRGRARASCVIDAAERTGVYIPRFCYHPRMRPVGMCRMCIVEIDTGRGPALQPALHDRRAPTAWWSTPSRAVTKKAQDGVLEFLLINHPLDCPVCDKGGECPLQDQTPRLRARREPVRRGEAALREADPDQRPRAARPRALHPLRPLHPLRQGGGRRPADPLPWTGATRPRSTPSPTTPSPSYFSGNTVQICPVGALTATPYRFKARPWDLEKVESTCTTCSVGCRIAVRVEPQPRAALPGRRHRPGQLGLAVRQGPVRLRGGRTASDRLGDPLVRDGGDDARAGSPWGEALRRRPTPLRAGLDAAGRRGRRPRRRPAHQRVRLRLGQAGQGRARHRQRRLPARRRAAGRGRARPARGPRSTTSAPTAASWCVLGARPQGGAAGPVPAPARRRAAATGSRSSSWPRSRTGRRRSLAAASLRYRPGEAGAVVRALLAGDGDRRRSAASTATALAAARAARSAPGRSRSSLGRPSLAESGRHDRRRRRRPARRPPRALRVPHAPCAGPTCTARSTWASPPGCCRAASPSTAAGDWFAERVADGARRPAASTPPGILQAAADGRIDTLVLLGADPLADFPDRDLARRALAGARTVIAVDTSSPPRSQQADVVLPAAGPAEVDGTTTNIEGRVCTVAQKVTPPGTARADWMHRRRARPPARRRPRPRVGRADLGRDRAVAPSYAGSPPRCSVAAGRDGVLMPLDPAQLDARRVTIASRATASTPRRPSAVAADADEADAADRGRRRRRRASTDGPTAARRRPPASPLPVRTAIDPPSSTPTRCAWSPPARSTTTARWCAALAVARRPGRAGTRCGSTRRLRPPRLERRRRGAASPRRGQPHARGRRRPRRARGAAPPSFVNQRGRRLGRPASTARRRSPTSGSNGHDVP